MCRNHGYPVTKQMKSERRKVAEQRLLEYNEKFPTTQDKLNALPPDGCKKQRTRLEAKLQSEQANNIQKK